MAEAIFLDITRLLTAGYRNTPSGIERVELAYADEYRAECALRFVVFFAGRLNFLPAGVALWYLESLRRSWREQRLAARLRARLAMGCVYIALCMIRLAPVRGRPVARRPVYLSLSHQNLAAAAVIARFKGRTRAAMLCFVHDLIPITHPEYARPGVAARHGRCMASAAGLADAVLVNSAATGEAFLRHFAARPKLPPVHVAPLGIAPLVAPATGRSVEGEAPYFLCVATIEPRKNHLLLLHLWRRFAESGVPTPRLILVGRRGWENEMVLDMLQRCSAIAATVEERRAGDAELARLLRGARALLLPSFAEGYGLPVAEALAAGTPVICSDLPALREVGQEVPEYLDPLDGAAWAEAILDYAEAASPRRAAQCARLRSWQAPSWQRHFIKVRDVIAALARDRED